VDLSQESNSLTINNLGSTISLSNGGSISGIEIFDGVYTGSGADRITFTLNRSENINTGEGSDTISSGLGNDWVNGGMGFDTLIVNYSTVTSSGINWTTPYSYSGEINASPDNRVSYSDIERFNVTGTSGADTLLGGMFKDTLIGGEGDDFFGGYLMDSRDIISGGLGIDRLDFVDLSQETNSLTINNLGGTISLSNGGSISGVEIFDWVYTGSGADKVTLTLDRSEGVYTGEGSDTISSGLGNDWVDGGMGFDTLIVNYSTITSSGINWTGSDIMASPDNRVSYSDIERFNVTGTSGADTLFGGMYKDTLIGGEGDDYFGYYFMDSRDIISGGTGIDRLDVLDLSQETNSLAINNLGSTISLSNGGSITGVEVFNNISTGSGADKVTLTLDRSENVYTGEGSDTISAGLGNDWVDGGMGFDTLIVNYSTVSSSGINWTTPYSYSGEINASPDNRVSYSDIERFNVTGTSGADTLFGGMYKDTLIGGAGDDLFGDYSYSSDSINGGTGIDTINSATFYDETENLIINNLGSTISLSNGGVITGVEIFNSIATGSGDDRIRFTLDRSETIYTGDGNDKINSGLGNDTISGGEGMDIFQLMTAGNIDTIQDFNPVDDTIQLENAVFAKLTTQGVLNNDNLSIGTTANDANDYVIYNPNTGELFYDADGSGATAQVQIALLGMNPAVTNADFVVI
jgi:Ca2+-binding RTX toxin-like protein